MNSFKQIMKIITLLWMLSISASLQSCDKGGEDTPEPGKLLNRKLNIIIGNQTLTAALYDNPTVKDFISRLPLTVDLADYSNAEKIFTPSPRLTTEDSPAGMNPKAGDIALFAPWGNIAIFYRGGTASNSLIPVGHIESDLTPLQVPDSIKSVRFELVNNEQPDHEDAPGETTPANNDMTITIASETFNVTLANNAAVTAFKALLPMTVTMVEMNGNEKYYNLPENLPTATYTPGTIQAGDIMLWGSNCVVLFYESFTTRYSYTRLGSVDNVSKLKSAVGTGNVSISFKLNNK